MEVDIKTKSTISKKFARCNNTKCQTIFLFEPREILGEAGILCPECRNKLDTHHVVQCQTCHTVIQFLEAEPSEQPAIYYVSKCSLCSGTVEDEKSMVPFYLTDAFI
jgi:hypothetical protein